MSSERRIRALATLGTEVRAWQSAQELFDGAVAELAGLNHTDWRCLDILGTQGPMTAGQLADAARLTTGAVTGILDHLEAAGYVRRVRDTVDRRRIIIQTAPDLEERAAPVYGPFLAESDESLRDFNAEQLELIGEFLRRNNRLLAKHTARVRGLLDDGIALASGKQKQPQPPSG